MNLAQISIARIRTGWSRFALDRRGAMAMTLGLLMTGFAGMTALSVDVADWYGSRRVMQSAADAAAMGGALALKNSGTNAQAIAAATTDAQLNATGLGAGAQVNASVNGSKVTVTLTKHANLLLSGLFLSTAPTITATATAGLVNMTSSTGGSPVCLLVTSPAAANVVVLSGSSSIQASGCRVVVNSASTSAINLSGNTVINSKTLCGPGGGNVSGSSKLNPAETGCSAMADPYANMPVPAAASATNPCKVTNFQTNGNNYYQYVDQNGTTQTNTHGTNTMTSGVTTTSFYYGTPGNTQSALHMTPGVYCGGISFGAFTNVVFDPGIYVLRNGGLNTSGNTTATGTGVAFYLTGTGTAVQLQNDFVDLSAQTTLTITAPTDPNTGMAGIAIYQDNSAATGTLTNTLSGNSTINFTGLLYFGNQNVTVSGSSENQSAGFTCMIAYTLNYSGFSTLYLNSNYASTTVPVPPSLSTATQQVVALTQ
jgi:Flp pilus assembly protein TadG